MKTLASDLGLHCLPKSPKWGLGIKGLTFSDVSLSFNRAKPSNCMAVPQ